MIKNFTTGMGFVVTGLGLAFNKRIRAFVLVPLLINIVIFSVAIWLGMQWLDTLETMMVDRLPNWLDWLHWLLWPLAIVVWGVTVFYGFTVVANLIAAPFNALLSERVEQYLDGKPVAEFAGFQSIPGILMRTIWSELRKIMYQVKWLLLLIILTFIPVVNVIAPGAWIWFGVWMLAIEYGDYPMGNHEYYFGQVKKTLKQHRTTAWGLGSGIMVLSLIPGFILLVMPVGVIAATVFWVKQIDTDTM